MVNNWLIPWNINENQNFVIANIIQLPNTLVCFGAIQRFKVLSTFAMLTTTNVKSSFHSERFILSALVMAVPPLTRLSRHQVHQAALLPSAGDGPLLPHVLEHLPLGRGLRLHGWVQAVNEAAARWEGAACSWAHDEGKSETAVCSEFILSSEAAHYSPQHVLLILFKI